MSFFDRAKRSWAALTLRYLHTLPHEELVRLKRALRDYDMKKQRWREPIAASCCKTTASCSSMTTIGVDLGKPGGDETVAFMTPTLDDRFTAIETVSGEALRCNRCALAMKYEDAQAHSCAPQQQS